MLNMSLIKTIEDDDVIPDYELTDSENEDNETSQKGSRSSAAKKKAAAAAASKKSAGKKVSLQTAKLRHSSS